MKLLLDTHTFIWWDSSPNNLSSTAMELLINPNNLKILSVATIWEMQIKSSLGKLNLKLSLDEIIKSQIKENNFQLLPIFNNHVLYLDNLPLYHKDPFDRILIAQANCENATLISKDSIFNQYSVNLKW
ncbi:MAG: type II toxin-antitoxin system VapC family toxin [Cyanobacteria bacterium]|nr:type II toxin-antitoxin system VapC family toxin [Cyanobacteria bacterium CG_2015-16_32_12]NCO77544.1 type II toxin-antitoxin system VapC family toxin [Cyanobacteria bacterium CG_2015-22_32_23]NCQ04581.1 type II toxin-antitoxin system VapC family toxin [Cyanobacteria bacterium CG_2015-09_32_10]NCQ42671.1 type II toxin-antitoxin system VapC family toxin [Cyanobacteria bacterium CG_2015-04_32_10]NCS84586.1 type II toxin-antitoxin system VapC family toxin [Cyanobacteria bacterium CG_2015-02_32_